MQTGHRRAGAHFGDLHPAHARVAFDRLREPEDAVGDGEDGVAVRLAGLVLTDEKGRRLPAGQVKREALHEFLELRFRGARARNGAERVDDDEARVDRFDLGEHALHHAVEILIHGFGAEVHEANRSADLARIEEGVLLGVAQHLQRRLAEHREVERGRFQRRT